ncbi:MAG: hypothetical protein MUE73_09450, partial [Planctomycetes bacterium]|nr:hypothetical protein [Planctomycetota bacterium]
MSRRCRTLLPLVLAVVCLAADGAAARGGKGGGDAPGASGGGPSTDGGGGGGSGTPKPPPPSAPTARGGSSVDGAEGALTERDPDAALRELIQDQMRVARGRAGEALLSRLRDREIAGARALVNHRVGDGGQLPANPPPPEPTAEEGEG